MKNDWELFLVLDPNLDPAKLYSPDPHRPVWVVDSPSNRERINKIRTTAESLPIAAFTIFNLSYIEDSVGDLSALIGLLDSHHPYMTRINIIGIDDTQTISDSLSACGFSATREMWPGIIAFRRQLAAIIEVPDIQLEALSWKTFDDVFDSLFTSIGAPTWHGRNFDALNDSIVCGDINSVEVPYRLIIRDLHNASPAAQSFAKDLIQLIAEFGDWGCPVWAQVATVQNSPLLH